MKYLTPKRRTASSPTDHSMHVDTKLTFEDAFREAGETFEVVKTMLGEDSNYKFKREFKHNGVEFWTVFCGEKMDWASAWETFDNMRTKT